MKVEIIFKELDPDYNQEYADTYQNGVESESNWKSLWKKSFGVEGNIIKHNLIESTNLRFKIELGENGISNIELPDMCVLECTDGDNIVTQFAVSNSILDKTYYTEPKGRNKFYFYFYIKNNTKWKVLNDVIYIDEKDFPNEIIESEKEVLKP